MSVTKPPFRHGMAEVVIRITSPDCFPGVASKLLRTAQPGETLPAVLDVPFFLQGMMNRMGVSYHKYGSFYEAFPGRKLGIVNALQRIKLYEEDGNIEWLIDAANYLMIEAQAPCHAKAHFHATDSDESPGSVLKDGSIDWGKGGKS